MKANELRKLSAAELDAKLAELKKNLKIDGDNVIDVATGEIVEGCAVVNTEETFEVE